MFVVYHKVLDLLHPVKRGGREMVHGQQVTYGKHRERCVFGEGR